MGPVKQFLNDSIHRTGNSLFYQGKFDIIKSGIKGEFTLEKQLFPEEYLLIMKLDSTNEIAYLEFNVQTDINDAWAINVEVENQYQRKGVATFMYDLVEQIFSIPMSPSDCLSSEAKLFWSNRSENHAKSMRK